MEQKYNEKITEIVTLVDKIDNLYMMWSKQQGENYYVSSVVYMLYASDIHRQNEMAERYAIPKQTVNTIISRLEKDGYVTLIPDEKDRRGRLVYLTEKGNSYAKSIVDPLMACEQKTLDLMGNQKVDQLIELLDEYALLLEHEMKKKAKKAE
jgi:DNA-binding MarR family transcriptional regulator